MADMKATIIAAKEHRIVLGLSKYTLAICAIAGSWMSTGYEGSIWMPVVLGLMSGWAVMCHLADGFARGYVIYTSISGLIYLIAAAFSPERATLLTGAMVGMLVYILILLYVSIKPKIDIGKSSGKFYFIKYPLQKLVPLMYLAPEFLSPMFSPVAAFHWSVGMFGIPVLKFSYFDVMSVHKYIINQSMGLEIDPNNWRESVYSFRRAVGILNLLDSIHRFEVVDLDGVALAASARLALTGIPSGSREVLSDVVKTMRRSRREILMAAWDLAP